MIKINLLPVREERRRLSAQQEMIFFILVIVLVVIGVFYWNASVNRKIKTVRNDIVTVDQEIKRLAKIVQEVEQFKKDKKSLENKIQVIGQLKQNRQAQVHYLDEINRALPTQIWLTFYQEKGGNIHLRGKSLATDEIANFMRNLDASAYFREVELEVTTQKPVKVGQRSLKINDFSIRLKAGGAPG